MYELKMKILKILKLKKGLIKYCVIIIIGLLFLIIGFTSNTTKANEYEHTTNNTLYNTEEKIMVEIIGEVKNPGIYYVDYDSCIKDLLRLCGGLTKGGTVEFINQAMKLNEGMRIIIPSKEDALGKISINNCSLEDLINIGLTKTKAQAIINYRKEKMWISYVDELTDISGISNSDYNQIKEFIIL